MLNAIGLQNVGVEAFLSEKLPQLARARATVIANVWGDLEEDYVTVVRALEGAEGSPPSRSTSPVRTCGQGGMLFGNSPALRAALRREGARRDASGRSS